MSIGLPACAYFMLLACNDISGCPAPSLLHPSTFTLDKFARDINWRGPSTIFKWEAMLATVGYHLLIVLLHGIMPYTEAYGLELQKGGRIKYRMNSKLVHL